MRRAATVIAAALAAFAVLLPVAGDAQGATPAWRVQRSANASGSNLTVLTDVACLSASTCFAVGHYLASAGSDAYPVFIERWNGSSWVRQAAPSPGGASNTSLRSVACWSTTGCLAVGYYDGSGTLPLSELWNGTSWAVKAVPRPSGGSGLELSAVACSGSRFCVAAGTYYLSGRRRPVVERWTGSSWAVLAVPLPSGRVEGGLAGIGCSSPTACTAAGFVSNSSGAPAPLAERWNGSRWTPQAAVLPTGAKNANLIAVACPTATACTAVGYYDKGAAPVTTLIEQWNGRSWSVRTSPNVSGSRYNYLSDVACSSATVCTAVGYYDAPAGSSRPLAARWTGAAWAGQRPPLPTGATSGELYGASLAGAAAVQAAGQYQTQSSSPPQYALTERFS